jgi:hypothetical protein
VALDGIDWDGLRLSCECGSAYAHLDRVRNTAPYSWKYNSKRSGERRLS